MEKKLAFPKNFYWGAATSAHQVEGNNHNNWSEWENERGLERSGRACDHYNRFAEDFDIAKSLGHNAHRFSIEWSRIEPKEGEFNEKEIEHYRRVIKALRERGLEPFVTLWHWTTPIWFRDQGDWLSPKAPFHFTRFVERVVKEFPEVTYWITLNEPNVYTGHGYLRGDWPPGERSLRKYFSANRNLAKAHTAAYKALKRENPKTEAGVAEHFIWFTRWYNLPRRFFFNRWFLNSIEQYQDFVGVNYYRSDRNLEN
ncbi:MAG: family 1 glycosylhydrolase, partial [Patescibacteria group bacterium]